MISTKQQAKDFAKKIKSTLGASGLHYPLGVCQSSVARALGFADWWTLTRAQRWPGVSDETLHERLLEALPFACRPPVIALLAGEEPPEAPPGFPPRWYLDAVPYYMANMALHRRTPLLRPGSGKGQRLRARIVDHLMLEWATAGIPAPLLDPISFDIVFSGRPEKVLAAVADHEDFEKELDRLVDAGILALAPDSVRVRSPGIDTVRAHAVWSRASKAKDFVDNDFRSSAEPIYEALSLIGVRCARDIALALLAYGDRRYVVASGSLREALSDIARDGDLDVFAHALNVFAFIFPASATELRNAVPAKILNEFVARNRKVPISSAFRWMNHNPDWPDRLRSNANDPSRFRAAAEQMVEGMRAA